jgi:hypothetical protein
LAYCTFLFRDAYGNQLSITTAGEAADEGGDVMVWSWAILTQEQLNSNNRALALLAAEVREEIARARENTATAARARRELAIDAGGLGGSRDRLYRDEADSRIRQLDEAASMLAAIESESDNANQPRQLADLDVLLAKARSLSAESSEDYRKSDSERFRMRRGS